MATRGNLAPLEWVDRYGDYLFRYAMLRLRDRSAAEDIEGSMDRSLPLGKRLAATVGAPGETFGDTLSEEARERIRKSIKNR